MRRLLLVVLGVFLSCGSAWGGMVRFDFLLTVQDIPNPDTFVDLEVGDTMTGHFTVDPYIIAASGDGVDHNPLFSGEVSVPKTFGDIGLHYFWSDVEDSALKRFSFIHMDNEILVLDLVTETFRLNGIKGGTGSGTEIFSYTGELTSLSPELHAVPEPVAFASLGVGLVLLSGVRLRRRIGPGRNR